jgi:hypothetical protein
MCWRLRVDEVRFGSCQQCTLACFLARFRHDAHDDWLRNTKGPLTAFYVRLDALLRPIDIHASLSYCATGIISIRKTINSASSAVHTVHPMIWTRAFTSPSSRHAPQTTDYRNMQPMPLIYALSGWLSRWMFVQLRTSVCL